MVHTSFSGRSRSKMVMTRGNSLQISRNSFTVGFWFEMENRISPVMGEVCDMVDFALCDYSGQNPYRGSCAQLENQDGG